MTRLVLLSVVAVGLMYAAYTSLLTAEFGVSDNTTRAEPLPLAQGTPWTEIDPAARNSSHAIVPDLSPTVALESLNSPIEVENVLLRHESVRAAAVVEGLDQHGLSCVCAFVVPQEAAVTKAAEDELRALCDGALPRFKQPRRYLFVSELPYTATGKVQRFKLREQLRSSESNL